VIRVDAACGSVLLTGDLERAGEQQLLAQPLRADVLLVPHHGSKTSSSQTFIDAVQPKLALVSAGYRNRFGHPRADVLQRYLDSGAPSSAVIVRVPSRYAVSRAAGKPRPCATRHTATGVNPV
jgi:beta-lactamase superfamily II metal-dependent hydrolase